MRALANRLRAPDPHETIRRIYTWVHRHARPFPGDRSTVLRRRTAQELFTKRTLSGCGDWGVLLASLLRAAGLPVVFVEAVGKRWIQRYLQGGESTTYEGHVFLEVRTPAGWLLLDSSLPYLYRGHRRGSDDLPRGYRAMARGMDSWDLGVRDEGSLHLAMHRAAQASEPGLWRDVRLAVEPILARMVVIGLRETVATVRTRLPDTRVLGVSPRRYRSWAARCHACDAVALLQTAAPPSLREAFLGVVREVTRLPAWEALPRSTPRFVAWKRGGLCLVIRDSEEALVRFAQDLDLRLRRASGALDAATCLESAPR